MKTIYLFLLLIPSLLVCNKYLPEEKLPENKIINYRIYSDERNSSFIPYESKCLFETIWLKPAVVTDETSAPLHIAVKDSEILVWYGNRIELVKKENGESKWNMSILPLAEFDLKQEGFVSIDHAGFYDLMDLESRKEQKFSLPFLSIQSRLYYSEKNGDEFNYCYQAIPTPTNAPGDSFSGPRFIYAKFDVVKNSFIWQFKRSELVKAVLRTRENNRISIITENNIYFFNADAASDEQVKTIPLQNISAASVDFSDNYLVYILNSEKRFELRSISPEGNVNWVYQMDYIPSIQPPASHPEGRIFILQGNVLECLEEGKKIWLYQLPANPGKSVISVIKDASILVSAERFLLHISANGELLMQKLFGEPLTNRAAVDPEGNIYIGNELNIYSLR